MKQAMVKKVIFISLLWLASVGGGAQNLVPNYSLEDTVTDCPVGNLDNVLYWFQPTMGTTDYFNACTPGGWNVPNGAWGYQQARTGVAHAGMAPVLNVTWREYMEARLIATLEADKDYCVEFHVSLANDSRFAIDRIGAHFSIDSISMPITTYLSLEPHIESPRGILLTDTTDWMRISGKYTAAGGEQFIIIGTFHPYDSVSLDTVYPNEFWDFAYYYVDYVYVREMDSIPSSIRAGNVKIICEGESVVLGTTAQDGYAYHWQGPGLLDTTSAEITVSPPQTTDYVLTVTDTMPKPYSCQPTKSDTVTVLIAPCDDTLKYNVWLPNVFSPNNDNNNDVLFVRGNNIASMELAIYDRWGEKVFESFNLSNGWDGSYKGEQLNPGVFVYIGKVVFTDDTEQELKGNVTLVR